MTARHNSDENYFFYNFCITPRLRFATEAAFATHYARDNLNNYVAKMPSAASRSSPD
jgi:hypothetical protein